MTNVEYQRRGVLDAIVEVLLAFKWHLTVLGILAVLGIGGSLWIGILDRLPSIPSWVWGVATYAVLTVVVAVLVYRWYDPPGTPIVELDPKHGDYRVLKVGPALWSDVVVEGPRDDRVGGVDDLSRITINGVNGVEVLALDVPDEDDSRPPVATPNWLAGATSAEVRSYRSTLSYIQDRLSERADRGTRLRANYPLLVREGVERILADIIRTTEREGVPSGERIQDVLDDVVGKHDPGDPGPDEDVRREVDEDRADLLDRDGSLDDRLSIDVSIDGEGSDDA
jgi:hypothetical protein